MSNSPSEIFDRLTTFADRCHALPPNYRETVSGEPVGEVVPYLHPDSRCRHSRP